MLRELPDGNNNAEDECEVSNGFQSRAAFFFGANQESICRFLAIVHKSVWLTRSLNAMTVPRGFYEL